jgi:hypothetical protein
MENETVNQEQATKTENAEKTFTQSELNAIISDRLKRESEKYADYETLKEKASRFDEIEEASKTELQKANERAAKLETELSQLRKNEEIRTIREKVATEHGIPTNLLTGETEETCIEQAKALIEFKGQATYPTVKDGGEVQNTIKGTTRQQFADWANAALN